MSVRPDEPEPAAAVHILVVDDEVSARKLIVRVLEQSGYTVREAGDGAAALRCLEQDDGRFRLLIADVMMPGMDGIELMHRARELRPELPVLFVSAVVAQLDARVPEGTPALEKPFRIRTLLDKVREALGQRGD